MEIEGRGKCKESSQHGININLLSRNIDTTRLEIFVLHCDTTTKDRESRIKLHFQMRYFTILAILTCCWTQHFIFKYFNRHKSH
uniref:Uncharacterized protein n=1 Tax=Glossina palpalis gambiensis TaxID=67801 RepID=A0A1B0BIE3_9MUSC